MKLLNRKDKEEMLDYQDLYSWVEVAPFKRMMNNRSEVLELANKDYGYMQILEVTGKDLNSLGEAEVQRTLLNYYDWLTQFTGDFTIYVTTLPTDTTEQSAYLRDCLNKVRHEMKACRDERLYAQLQDRESILLSNIRTEELIRHEIYNVEFILFLFGKTVKELEENVRKAKSYGRGDFAPKDVSADKKVLILKQYNSMNDKL